MRRPPPIVTERDVPPANHPRNPTKCGWCKSVIEQEHEPHCVIRQRSVVARLTIEFVTTIPESWDVETLERVHNGNCFCASNYLDVLVENGRDFCVCGYPPETGFAYVREANEDDETLLPWAYKWRAEAK